MPFHEIRHLFGFSYEFCDLGEVFHTIPAKREPENGFSNFPAKRI